MSKNKEEPQRQNGKGNKKSSRKNNHMDDPIDGICMDNEVKKDTAAIVTLCVDCQFIEVNRNTHKKNHWMISLKDLFKEINPLLQGNAYLYSVRPYRSKIEELQKIITNISDALQGLLLKLNITSTPQQQIMEAIEKYSSKECSETLQQLVVSIQKNLKVHDGGDSSSFFELVESSKDSVCSFSEAEQIVVDLRSILRTNDQKLQEFSMHVEDKEKSLQFSITEQNIQDLLKQVEGATSITLKESWCSDDVNPLCTQVANALNNNQSAQLLDIDFSRLPLEDKGAEPILKAIRFIKPINKLTLALDQCELGNGTAKSIAKLLEINRQIKHLKLSLANNNVKYEGLKALSMGIAGNKGLELLNLNLKNNKLGHDGIKQLVKGFGMNQSLKTLKLSLEHNELGDKGIIHLAEALSKNKYLSKIEINLQYNNITPAGIEQLMQIWLISSESKEIKLNLIKNSIGVKGARMLFDGIKQNEFTKTFSAYLSENKITHEESKEILIEIDAYLELKKAATIQNFSESIIFSF